MFLTQSAGGRVASMISDDVGIDRLVCLGYPFQNPTLGPEPERYLHLQTLKTPFLIFQGIHDPYGGKDVVSCAYRLSPNVKIEFVDTDHDFKLEILERRRVVKTLKEFLEL
jgi:predicted alpha/beta-hydrolase family hydrolase